MISKKTLRVAWIGASLTAMSLGGFTYAADEPTPPAKPAAPADQPGPTTRRSPADMLKNFRDQFEGLNLTDDQMKKIDGFLETAEAEVKKAAASEDRETRRGAFQAIRKLNEDVQSILTDTQKTALAAKRQSMMFDRITKTYTKPELKLTDEQTTKITGIIADAKKAMGTLSFQNEDDRPKIRAAMEDMSTKLKAVLTPDQLKLIPPQRGFRGGNRGGGGANPPA